MKTSTLATRTRTSATSAAPTLSRLVARPYSVQGKFFNGKFKDRVTTRGSLRRPPTLAMVGGRCMVEANMEEGSSSSAQRATLQSRRWGWRRYSGGSQRGGSPWCCGYKMSGVLELRKHRSSIGGWTGPRETRVQPSPGFGTGHPDTFIIFFSL